MKKESLIAIIFGIILGSILGLIIFEKNRRQQLDKSKIIVSKEQNHLITPKVAINPQLLEIIEPKDMAVVSESKVTIQGSASKNSLIIVQSPFKDLVLKNNQSEFKIEFPLALGENIINIVVYPKESQFRPQNKKLRIYYLPEEL